LGVSANKDICLNFDEIKLVVCINTNIIPGKDLSEDQNIQQNWSSIHSIRNRELN
jgi:hypothetical protein